MRAPMRKASPAGAGVPLAGGEGMGDRPSTAGVDLGPLNHERCIHCNRLARPCILMFDDGAWLGDSVAGPAGAGHDQAAAYRQVGYV